MSGLFSFGKVSVFPSTGYSQYWVLRASARLQGQQRVHLNSSRPVLQLE